MLETNSEILVCEIIILLSVKSCDKWSPLIIHVMDDGPLKITFIAFIADPSL